MKIINKYTSNGEQLVTFEINNHINTMPLKYFIKKHGKIKTINSKTNRPRLAN